MSKGLKIYACSGIGSADSSYGYWTDGTKSVSNTQAVNNLLAKINLEYAKVVNLQLSDEEIMRCLDNIDLYCVCMYYAREYGNNSFELHHVGQVISDLVINRNLFESNLLTDEERGLHLDELFDMVDKAMDSSVQENAEFMKWWKENVEDLNQVGLSKQQQTTVTGSLMGDMVGATEYNDADLNKYLNDAGEYFLYTYFTAEQLKKMPAVFRRKANIQKNTYQYCKALYEKQNGTEESMKQIIRAGIISTLKAEPEVLCKGIYDSIVSGDVSGNESVGTLATALAAAGLTVAEFLTILSTVFTFVVGVITAICTAVAQVKVAQAQSVDIESVKDGAPNEDDYPPNWKASLTNNSDLLLLGAAAIALWFLLKK